VVALAAIVEFAALAGHHIRLPGLYYDELFELTPALAFVKGGLGSDVAWIPGTEISIAGHPLPLMAHTYVGAVKTIAFAPVAAAFGITPTSVRVFTIAVAALSLVFTYLFARKLFRSAWVAAIGTVLVATDPSFVFYSRVDFGPAVFMFLFKAAGLLALLDWWRGGRLRSLCLGAFAFGLGVYDKANFVWIVAAVFLAALLIDYSGVRRRLDRRSTLWAGGAFAVGALPFLVYNASWPPRSLRPALNGTLHISSGGGSHGNPLLRLGSAFGTLVRLLDGDILVAWFTGGHGAPPVLAALSIGAAALVVLLYAVPRLRPRLRAAMFVVLSGALVLVACALTPGAGAPHHVLLVYPAPQLGLAAVAVGGPRLLGGRARLAAAGLGAAAVAACFGVGVATTAVTLSRLDRTGGIGGFSDRIYTLDRYLLQHDSHHRLVVLDWGIYQNLIALSNGTLRGTELWQDLNSRNRLRGRVTSELDDPSARYVLHAPQATLFPRARSRFFAIVRRERRHALLEHRIATRLGQPLFEIYRLG
jgi:Dolichyl-phosphate-mannose-protein mannosyltransferase